MNHKVKRKWVAALRSGQYLQCRRAYQFVDAYCALGVLKHCVEGGLEEFHRKDKDRNLLSLFTQIVYLNDYKRCTFPQIADAIENYEPQTEQ